MEYSSPRCKSGCIRRARRGSVSTSTIEITGITERNPNVLLGALRVPAVNAGHDSFARSAHEVCGFAAGAGCWCPLGLAAMQTAKMKIVKKRFMWLSLIDRVV